MFTNLLPTYFIASTTALMTDLFSGIGGYLTLIISIIGVSMILEVILSSHKR